MASPELLRSQAAFAQSIGSNGDRLPRSQPISSPNSASSTAAQAGYVLGSGDHIVINVFGYEEYTGDRTILPDGTISVPLLGSIRAAGRTTDQLAQELTRRLEPFLVDPAITVSLSILRAVSVNVAGEVLRPGRVQLQGLPGAGLTQQLEQPTLSMALTKAGGITQYADIRQVVLKRSSPDGISESTINLWDAIGSLDAPPEVVLQDGDSIYIPRLMAEDTSVDRRRVAQSSFAPATVRVRVVGEVTQPGEVAVPPNSSVSSAVAIAGGPTQDARLSQVAFVRLNAEGAIERQILDLRNLTDNYQIQDGDVVIVPKRGSSSFIDMAGRVLSPLGLLFGIFR
ncbi:MAG: polysaccharide export protein [Leptolyngbyaceae cyanobacterium CSU_1_4]|nr:polysaccharide export protein [Leptolyngbyaceae cyanobacterium CSU_1_4]